MLFQYIPNRLYSKSSQQFYFSSNRYRKMFFVLYLPSILVALTILNTVSPTPVDILFEDVDIEVKKDLTTADIVGVVLTNSLTNKYRPFILNYVLKIQNSSIWTEIKKRSMTVINESSELFQKSLTDMTDQELFQLFKMCHNGLKCAAVHHLLVLNKVMVPLSNGLKLVRTAIIKITKVVSEFTSEYYEDQYEYEEVTESDDLSKISETVTTIVKDNMELCRVDIDHEVEDTKDEDIKGITIINKGILNLGPVNMNVNNGTMNTANVQVHPSDITVQDNKDQPKKQMSHGQLTINVDPKNVGNQDNVGNHTNQEIRKIHSPTSASAFANNSDDDNVLPVKQTARSENRNDYIVKGNDSDEEDDKEDYGKDMKNVMDVNIAKAGSNNINVLKKGYVKNGHLNNGKMTLFNSNSGSENTGIISNSNGEVGGIINVGTINNGDTNYGTTNIINDNTKLENLVGSINNMYDILLLDFKK